MAIRGKNEGTIFRKPNGSWMAQASVNGKRISHGSKSRALCAEWLRKTLDQVDQGMTFEARSLTLGAYLKEWMCIKRSVLRTKTAHQYQRLIDLYIEPALGRVKLKDLNIRAVNRFYQSLLAHGVGLYQIRAAHRVLHAALEQAVRSGTLGRNAAHGAIVPKVPHKEMETINEQEVALFLLAASQSRYRALFHLALVTAMRISEIRGLRWSDVDWLRGTIKVARQVQDIPGQGPVAVEPKTQSGNRSILLGENTLNELKAQKLRVEQEAAHCPSWQDNDLIFPSSLGTPFAKTDLERDYHALLKQANVRRIRFHDLRHSSASIMLNHGIPPIVVSKILGHANPTVTLLIYAHSNLEMQTEAAALMDSIISPIAVDIQQLQPSATICNQEAIEKASNPR